MEKGIIMLLGGKVRCVCVCVCTDGGKESECERRFRRIFCGHLADHPSHPHTASAFTTGRKWILKAGRK